MQFPARIFSAATLRAGVTGAIGRSKKIRRNSMPAALLIHKINSVDLRAVVLCNNAASLLDPTVLLLPQYVKRRSEKDKIVSIRNTCLKRIHANPGGGMLRAQILPCTSETTFCASQ